MAAAQVPEKEKSTKTSKAIGFVMFILTIVWLVMTLVYSKGEFTDDIEAAFCSSS